LVDALDAFDEPHLISVLGILKLLMEISGVFLTERLGT
jgi:hypothetical protein